MKWKNGKGKTVQFFIHPEDIKDLSEPFSFRLSSADLLGSGPFSKFEGYYRHLIQLPAQNGIDPEIVLEHPEIGKKHALKVLEPYYFDGNLETFAEQKGGDTKDFNVFTRKGQCEASIQVFELNGEESKSIEIEGKCEVFVYCFAGKVGISLSTSEHPRIELDDKKMLRIHQQDSQKIIVVSKGKSNLILTRIK
eukprot:TRINITY_DN5558_c0_g1_i1.p1 TRINITY_DN5558_c0_g1~~TRINITY_DN5558_c0_g1_i1.p1  ORF type:complete len:223 (-),score=64.67 TRINITY_DN5558_c0_g1_i1:4-585(-)